jgi:quinol monooxygenase YgiN
MSQQVNIIARIAPHPDHWMDARDAILGILERTWEETGCMEFRLSEGVSDGCLYLYEEWSDEEALAFHHNQPYTLDIFERYKAWLREPVQVTRLRPVR